MSHKTEAEKLLSMAYNEMSDSGGFFEVQAAFAEATLALAEAQEAANEQARLGNLIAFWQMEGGPYKEINRIATTTGDAQVEVRNAILKGLGIEVAE